MPLSDLLQNKVQLFGIGVPVVAVVGVAAYFLLFRRKRQAKKFQFNF